jgi:TIR domain
VKVFISWSGPLSRQIAEALRDWLPMAIQAVKPYMSRRDNEAGARWEEIVSSELSASHFGILCLTPDNLKSTWLNFEAGALGKAVDRARVVPLLYKITDTDVERPLGMFMAKTLDREGVKETLETMNKHLDAEVRLDQATLDGAFEAMWPILEERLANVQEHDVSGEPEPREDRAILAEILGLVRGLSAPYGLSGAAFIPSETAGGLSISGPSVVGGLSRLWTTAPVVRSGGTNRSALWDRLADIFGPFISYTLDDKALVIQGVPADFDLSPDAQSKFDQLVDDLKRAGVAIAFLQRRYLRLVDNPPEETEPE